MSVAKRNIVVLTGAGMSAESGLLTFRDAGGLWEGHDVMQVATPEGWAADMDLVLNFYNQRRKQLLTVKPNAGHLALVDLEEAYNVNIITQNVDDLHERAGSQNVLHLHGELLKVRSTRYGDLVYPWSTDLLRGHQCERGAQLRPHIVWFGEQVPMLEIAIEKVSAADIVIVIGSSMQVYPAASLVHFAPEKADIYYIDPRPQLNAELASRRQLQVITRNASDGVTTLVQKLLALPDKHNS